jgi:hypothetical protein
VTLDEIVRDAGGGHLRANYHRLIARAVKGLESTAEGRQVIYERARKALIAHLRFNQPGLSKAVIVKERLALEDAIRKIEAEAAGESRTPTEPQPAMPSVGMPDGGTASEPPRCDDANPAPADMPEGGWPAVLLSEQLLSGWSSLEKQAVKGFRDVVREVHDFGAETAPAAQTTPQSREACEEEAAVEAVLNPRDLNWPEFDMRRERDFEHAYGSKDEQRTGSRKCGLHAAPRQKGTRRTLSYSGLATLLVALVMGLAAAVFWQRSAITDFYVFLSHTGWKPQTSHKTPPAQPKLSGRVPQQQSSAEARGIAVPGGHTAATQRVVLYEENPTDPQGKRYTGSAVWRTETVSPGPGFATELAVRADVTIPERSMAVTWSLRRSADKVAYTIETTFDLPADFPGGGIANVPGILMKQSEQARGTELAGLDHRFHESCQLS